VPSQMPAGDNAMSVCCCGSAACGEGERLVPVQANWPGWEAARYSGMHLTGKTVGSLDGADWPSGCATSLVNYGFSRWNVKMTFSRMPISVAYAAEHINDL